MPLTDDFMLPRWVRTMEQMADLLQAEEAEINQAQRTINAMAAQLAVGTSTFLLPRHERIFGLSTNTAEGLEVRRARVLARLNARGVTTAQAIRELVQIITGREGEVTEHFADYAFSVTVRLLFPDATKDLGELIRQIDEIKPAHLVFDTIAAVEPVVLENRQQLSFAALTVMLIHRNKAGGSGMIRLVFPLRAVNRCETASLFTVLAKVSQPSAAKFIELLVGRYRVNNLGIEETLLNGKRPLNGEWYLSASFSKGVRLSRFVWNGRAINRQKAQESVILLAQAQNPRKGVVSSLYRAFERNTQTVRQQCFSVTARATNVQRTAASLTSVIDRKLDGTFYLNGAKKMNAGTIRSEL